MRTRSTTGIPMSEKSMAKRMFIAGEWRDASNGETMAVVNPATEDVIATVPKGTEADAKAAADAAQDAKKRVHKVTAWDRYQFLSKAARLLEEHQEEMARLITLEAGKPIRDARIEARRAVITFTYAAEEAKRIYGEVFPPDAYPLPPGNENRIVFSVREPIGTVVCISPFNFPLNLLCHKVAPALAAGNCVIAKPTSETPLVAIRLVELLLEAGVPKDAVQIVTGPGRTVGNALVESPNTEAITFTGSTQIGTQIASLGGKRAKRIILEMGGMDPVIILDDADLPRAVEAVARATFGLAGQVCIASKRILAAEKIADQFSGLLADRVSKFKVADPGQEDTDIGPVISASSREFIHTLIMEAKASGAKVKTGGDKLPGKGYFYKPTVLADVTSDMRVMQDEPFGPIGPVQSVASDEEAVEIANSSMYGLQSSVYSRDLRRALRVAREIKAGGVMINDPTTIRWDNMPFGGVKLSGLGREGVRYAIQEMTETKLINMNLA